MNLAPVVVFAYNRPQLLQTTLQSLRDNELSSEIQLFIYCDGLKTGSTLEQLSLINEVRAVAKTATWCKKLEVIEAPVNKGLAASVISGVSDIVNRFGKIIVVEDDILLSKYFLRFMNDALDMYKEDDRVLSIGSWNYFADSTKLTGNFFLRYPDSIAWATFARAWKLFSHDAVDTLNQLREKKLLRQFNCNLPEKYFERMLVSQTEGKIDSWAIRWTATSILHNKLNFYPRYSLSKHLGFVASATHESSSADYNSDLQGAKSINVVHHQTPIESTVAVSEWKKFIIERILKRPSIARRTINRIKRLLYPIFTAFMPSRGKTVNR